MKREISPGDRVNWHKILKRHTVFNIFLDLWLFGLKYDSSTRVLRKFAKGGILGTVVTELFSECDTKSRFYWWSTDPGSVTSVTMWKDAVNESQTSVCCLKDQRKQSDSLMGPSKGSSEQWKMSMKTVTHGRNTPVTIFKFIWRTTVYIIWVQDLQKGTPVYFS